ncbi:nucleotidyl transferase AbiEii/AbiGii toxin family protein [Patescibacteria group bacterium]|nr:nucleotidyl transferase AbiEii/AbiGii toxin family protein [Patescibacteria group bacterium]MCL5010229.1 nucleotidyl transferase AbiEii/AbiGii toxin family protein [Patescibacteria group bacterium]
MGKTILTPNQQLLLDKAAENKIITSDYYLTGGTALSEFYLQHRLSEDLDFFTENELSETDIAAWVKTTAKILQTKVTLETLRGQLIYYFSFSNETVKVDFAYFPFQVLGKYKKYKGLRIASLEDIAVNKLQAILTRSRSRDYFDIYEILKNNKSTIEQMRKDYRLKFDVFVPDEQLARRLTAVLDAKDQPRFLKAMDWKIIEQFFLTQAKSLQPNIIV